MEDVEFIDAEDKVNFNQDYSFKQCVLNHLAKISSICTKEYMAGYWEKKPVGVGGTMQMVEKYHEDTREAYCNSVKYLYILLVPHFDKDINITFDMDNDKPIKEKLQQADTTFLELSKLLKRKGYFEAGVLRQ